MLLNRGERSSFNGWLARTGSSSGCGSPLRRCGGATAPELMALRRRAAGATVLGPLRHTEINDVEGLPSLSGWLLDDTFAAAMLGNLRMSSSVKSQAHM